MYSSIATELEFIKNTLRVINSNHTVDVQPILDRLDALEASIGSLNTTITNLNNTLTAHINNAGVHVQ